MWCRRGAIVVALLFKITWLPTPQTVTKNSLKPYGRSVVGRASQICSKLSPKLVLEERDQGWMKIEDRCKMHNCICIQDYETESKIDEGDLKLSLIPNKYSCKLDIKLGHMVAQDTSLPLANYIKCYLFIHNRRLVTFQSITFSCYGSS